MKRAGKWLLAIIALGSLGAVGVNSAQKYWRARNQITYRTMPVVRGEIISVVNSTGTVQPVLSVQVGAAVSGPVESTMVDFNSRVSKGDVLAKIDPRTFKANVARDEASLAYRKAEVARSEALLEQAVNDENRARDLRKSQKNFISDTEMDQFKAQRRSLQAQLELAKAGVKEAEANLGISKTNLEYTIITSPVDGVIIDRKIDPGQTVAAAFQTPVMFVVAPDMEKEMNIYASVDEADIGLIREAQEREQPVLFTVDAYPDDLFEGRVDQVRLNPTTTQNVVTYTVVVKAPNAELKLLPGMTASLSFQIERRDDILKVANAALRFYPKPEQVREEDRPLLEGNAAPPKEDEEEIAPTLSASEKSEAARRRNQRHVWVQEGELLRAVEITTGLSDNVHTEITSGKLSVDQAVVTGIEPPKGAFGGG